MPVYVQIEEWGADEKRVDGGDGGKQVGLWWTGWVEWLSHKETHQK